MARRRTHLATAMVQGEEPEEASGRLSIVHARPDEPVVDLLHRVPTRRVDTELLRQALRFAFEAGDAGGLFQRAVEEAPVAPSTWDPANFEGHLYLEALVERCFRVRVDGKTYTPSEGYLVRLLGRPPRDLRDTELRQAVLRELIEQPELRASLRTLYVALRELRALLDERPIAFGETLRRKLDLLVALRTVIDTCAHGFAGASSALGRLRDYGQRAMTLDAYARLLQILDFDGHLATLEVRFRLGADGRIRDFALLSARENEANPLRPSPWRRVLTRIVGVLFGYRYTEQEVILRVIDDVFRDLEDAVLPCFGLIGDVEMYLAALGFRDTALELGLPVCLPELVDPPAFEEDQGGPRRIEQLYNPLLILQDVVPVPCDVDIDRHDGIVIVTGPNSGGKTRLLQALGIAHLLAQSGLFVPAASARLTRAPTLFASLIDRAPADQKEGRLGTELLRVRRLFEQLEPGSVVLLDELCSGTNPSEGEAIFEMVVGLLPRLRPQVWVTTHFLDAAERLAKAGSVERISFLQVELDEHAEPTYRFVPGVAGTSLAQQVAERLGVTHEELSGLVEARLEAVAEEAQGAEDEHAHEDEDEGPELPSALSSTA